MLLQAEAAKSKSPEAPDCQEEVTHYHSLHFILFQTLWLCRKKEAFQHQTIKLHKQVMKQQTGC